MGRKNGSVVFASETCAFDLLEAEYERSVDPGEIVIVDQTGVHSDRLWASPPLQAASAFLNGLFCQARFLYF